MSTRFYFFLLAFLFLCKPCIAQELDKKVFQRICEELLKKDSFASFRIKVQDVNLAVDPVSGEEEIIYKDSVHFNTFFKRYSIPNRIKIIKQFLEIPENSIFPLHDTIVIIDSSLILSELSSVSRKHSFKVHHCNTLSCNHFMKNTTYLNLKGVYLRDNFFTVAIKISPEYYLYIALMLINSVDFNKSFFDVPPSIYPRKE